MSQPSNHPSPLSVYWAFVVQFDTHTDVARGHLAGRVEHEEVMSDAERS